MVLLIAVSVPVILHIAFHHLTTPLSDLLPRPQSEPMGSLRVPELRAPRHHVRFLRRLGPVDQAVPTYNGVHTIGGGGRVGFDVVE